MRVGFVMVFLVCQVFLFAKPGDLDIGFGTNGIVTTNIGSGDDDTIESIAIQADGKIVAGGYAYEENEAGDNDWLFALARYNPNGTLDTTFGTNGKVMTDIGNGDDDTIYSIAIQTDGKIVVGGYAHEIDGEGNDRFIFALARYNPDGTLDTTFGTNGKVMTDIGNGDDDTIYSIAIQADGKIVAGGYAYEIDGEGNDGLLFALVRYNPDGTLDTTFGTNGKVTTDVGSGDDDTIYSIAIQADGKIVAVGYSENNTDRSFTVARYNPDGSFDTTFGRSGIVITDMGENGSSDKAYDVALQRDGKIVVVGVEDAGKNYIFAMARYNPDGSLDTTFGKNGKVTTDIGSGSDKARSVAIQNNGKIVVAGYSSFDGNYAFSLVRYLSDGALDTTFGTDGKVITDIGSKADRANSMALQKDGKIVAAGFSSGDDGDVFALVRYEGDTLTLTPIYYLLQ